MSIHREKCPKCGETFEPDLGHEYDTLRAKYDSATDRLGRARHAVEILEENLEDAESDRKMLEIAAAVFAAIILILMVALFATAYNTTAMP